MGKLSFFNPSIVICEWLPMGRNNMSALNRHLGSHKQYKAPTEFGMEGVVEDISKGQFKMKNSGCFLEPVDFTFSGSLKATLKNNFKDQQAKGVELDKDGCCYIGLKLKNKVPIDKTKELIGKTEIEFTRQFVPLLADNQVDLLECAYGVDDIIASPFALSSYSMVVTDALIGADNKEVAINDTEEFIKSEEFSNVLMPVTDWIISHFTIKGCHIFIGMKAMVCIGPYPEPVKELLKGILFQKTILNVSMRMFSNLWAKNKRLTSISESIPKATYKLLKDFNVELGKINNHFSRQNVVSDMMIDAIKKKRTNWDKLIAENKLFQRLDTGEGLKEEQEKSEDRILIIKQMYIDIEGLRDQLQQRMSLIMTKNGQQLNLTLLVLTLISVLGIADIFGFTFRKTILVIFVVAPFIYFAIRSFIRYRKHFN
ncbi:MAG: hypothetical protein V2I62_02935 [Bacteroidales bacterium]|jgi:hypothetical protein|nr:hypothetical protein [Bacteroidales bacterium]